VQPNHGDAKGRLTDPGNDNEVMILEETLEHVEFAVQLARIDGVEYLCKDKCIEH